MCAKSPQSRVAKALYTLNNLKILEKCLNPVILNHFLSLQSSGDDQLPKPKVMVQDLLTSAWEGPGNLTTWGCGYACISMDTGTHWAPARCVRPAWDHNSIPLVTPQQTWWSHVWNSDGNNLFTYLMEISDNWSDSSFKDFVHNLFFLFTNCFSCLQIVFSVIFSHSSKGWMFLFTKF